MYLDLTRRFLGLLFGFTCAALLAGCAGTRGGPIPYEKELAAPDAPSVVALESGYKIAPMDKLAIKVFKMEDLTGDYDVDLAGHISLPLIGEVEAGEDLPEARVVHDLDRRPILVAGVENKLSFEPDRLGDQCGGLADRVAMALGDVDSLE